MMFTSSRSFFGNVVSLFISSSFVIAQSESLDGMVNDSADGLLDCKGTGDISSDWVVEILN